MTARTAGRRGHRPAPTIRLVTPEARIYLAGRLSAARAVVGLGDITERRAGLLAHFGGALEAFRAVGAVTDDELVDWNRRMLVALGVEPPPPAPAGAAQAVWFGPGEPPSAAPSPPRAAVPEFIGVIPGPGELLRTSGGDLRVLAVELYDYGVVVRWRVTGLDLRGELPDDEVDFDEDLSGLPELVVFRRRLDAEHRWRQTLLSTFALEDDAGTLYRSTGASSGGGPDDVRGEATFTPRPPAGATRLGFRWRGGTLDIPMRPGD